MNHDGLLVALGAAPRTKTKPTTKYRNPCVPSLNVGMEGGLNKGIDEDRHPDPYLTTFKKAPLPHKYGYTHVSLKNLPRTSQKWVVEQEYQQLGGEEDDFDKVRRCVPYEVLRAVNPQLIQKDGNVNQIPELEDDWDKLNQQWVSLRNCFKPSPASRNLHLSRLYKKSLPQLPISPKSTSTVRVKRCLNADVILNQSFDEVLAQYSQFSSRFFTLGTREQEAWRVHWGTRNQQLRHCIERYLTAGLFNEVVCVFWCNYFISFISLKKLANNPTG